MYKYCAIVLIIFLIFNVTSDQQSFEHLIEITQIQHENYHFENFIIFFQKGSHKYEHLVGQFLINLHQKFINIPIMLWTCETLTNLQLVNHVNLNSLSFLFIDDDDKDCQDSILHVTSQLLEHMHYSKIIIHITTTTTTEHHHHQTNLTKLIDWCWDERFINVAILLQTANQLNIYTINPFPQPQIQIIISNYTPTKSNNLIELFPNKVRNLRGYKFESLFKDQIPRTFVYQKRNGELRKSGSDFKILINFVDYLNGSFIEFKSTTQTKHINSEEILHLIESKQIEISFMSMFQETKRQHLYPLSVSPWCVMVPATNEIPGYQYYILPFSPGIWILLLIMVIYLTLIELLIRKLNCKQFDFGLAFLNGICKIIFIVYSIKSIHMKRTISNLCLIILYSLIGFIVSNLYVAFLSSFLTTTVFEIQPNSWHDFHKYHLKIHQQRHC